MIKNAKKCNPCAPVGKNGSFTTPNSCAFECNAGYVKKNNKCDACSPVANAAFITPNSCTFECNLGYEKKNNKCDACPPLVSNAAFIILALVPSRATQATSDTTMNAHAMSGKR